MLYWYNWFSWWWARGCSKHVENWNKHIEKNCASNWSFTKNHNKLDGKQNIKIQFGLWHWNNPTSADPLQYASKLSVFIFFFSWALASSLTRFLDHTQRRTTVGRTSLNEWSGRRRDLYLYLYLKVLYNLQEIWSVQQIYKTRILHIESCFPSGALPYY